MLAAVGKHWMQTIYALEEKREGKIVAYKVGKKDCEKFSSLQYTFYESHEGHSFKISYKQKFSKLRYPLQKFSSLQSRICVWK